ncbi:helix-turn-helix transcriptional regulator [Caballeronia sp. LZ062]|uniref:helix-turn-helix domain-containing protein n=1 Tax=unclassified Caballeronia TaxID=2646786 RepID=UPI0028597B21|nr:MULTISPECIES: helix-turn-helix transcriptional regulator [unclassified Caballeronia]MDR5854032.1 helix-turn-helix transcriptional regulator [Caballeronia sp. LZ050]MDR5871437.1 helix-turn-helix transcriptional regulator [Caballeronia sp. LZ062]
MSISPLHQRASTELGGLLRHWREVRGVSQLELSLIAGISQRQISFIESGRSVPGRQTLLTIAQSLDVPLRERNALLLSAGYAPMYSDAKWNDNEMSVVMSAAKRMLQQHEPFPAIVMDRYWNVLLTNRAAPDFFNCFIDMAARTGPRNMLHLMFEPEGMRPHIADWETVALNLIQRVHREAVGRVIDIDTQRLLDALFAYPGVRPEWRSHAMASSSSTLPVVPMGFVRHGTVLNYFSMITTVETPSTIAAQEVRIECMFPADEETEARHVELLKAARQ